jgi:hypothetical protein
MNHLSSLSARVSRCRCCDEKKKAHHHQRRKKSLPPNHHISSSVTQHRSLNSFSHQREGRHMVVCFLWTAGPLSDIVPPLAIAAGGRIALTLSG